MHTLAALEFDVSADNRMVIHTFFSESSNTALGKPLIEWFYSLLETVHCFPADNRLCMSVMCKLTVYVNLGI